jgi:hypothetical protein
MSKLGVNFTEPRPRARRGPLAGLGHALLLGICLGVLGWLALRVLGASL